MMDQLVNRKVLKNRTFFLFPKLLFFFWLFAITVISLVDYSSMGSITLTKNMGSGFWLHVAGYFVAGVLFFLAFGRTRQKRMLMALTALFLLGVLFEVLQIPIPKRTFNPTDIAANGLGLVAFYAFYQIAFSKQLRKKHGKSRTPPAVGPG